MVQKMTSLSCKSLKRFSFVLKITFNAYFCLFLSTYHGFGPSPGWWWWFGFCLKLIFATTPVASKNTPPLKVVKNDSKITFSLRLTVRSFQSKSLTYSLWQISFIKILQLNSIWFFYKNFVQKMNLYNYFY